MRALLVIKPRKTNGGETLVKSVELDDDALPHEGTSFRIAELDRELDVFRVLTENVPDPEIHFRRNLTTIEAHTLKSLGWKKV